MPQYIYKIVPAPERARKIKSAKTPEARFAATLEEDMNALGEDGWEFLRTETFDTTERAGIAGKKSVPRHVMVYRRLVEPVPDDIAPLPFRAVEERPLDPPLHTPEAQADPARGPRAMGRPIPPVTRARHDESSRSETDG